MTILSVLVATIFAFAWSWIYYSPLLAWKAWHKAAGLKKDDIEEEKNKNMLFVMINTFVLYFVQFFIFSFILSKLWVVSMSAAIIVGVLMVIFMQCDTITQWIHEHRKFKLAMIHTFDSLVRFILGACILIGMM